MMYILTALFTGAALAAWGADVPVWPIVLTYSVVFLCWAHEADFTPADQRHRLELCDRNRRKARVISEERRIRWPFWGPAVHWAMEVGDEEYGPRMPLSVGLRRLRDHFATTNQAA
jgi:hypothetical protein